MSKVRFRNAVAGTAMENYWNNGGAVAFSRGNKGFFAMAKGGSMDQTLSTGNMSLDLMVVLIHQYISPRPTCWNLL